jgi:hypothetical protein
MTGELCHQVPASPNGKALRWTRHGSTPRNAGETYTAAAMSRKRKTPPASASGEVKARPRARGLDRLLLLILLGGLALRLLGIADRLPSREVADNPFDDTAVDEGDRRAMQYA